MLRRVLDWGFPQLGETMVMLRSMGAAGEFHGITWPGLSGLFQGVAKGRFAIAINQAPMRRHGAGFLGDWLKNRLETKRSRALPPAHLLRQVFETAPDYAAAKEMLRSMEIAVPAILVLAGPDDGCIIERTEKGHGVREMAGRPLCTTNHFLTALDRDGLGWRPRPIDSAGRLACASGLCETHFHEDSGWFVPPIANPNSRLAFEATAAGRLILMGTAGAKPVTQTLRL